MFIGTQYFFIIKGLVVRF